MTFFVANTKEYFPSYLNCVYENVQSQKIRIPVGVIYSANVQTASESYPASDTVGAASFQRVKWSVRGVQHPPYLAASLKKEWS
jgi:hypothetical protein